MSKPEFNPRKPTFEQWMEAVDQHVLNTVGLGYQDLPDCPYRDWYDDGVSAKRAASRAIKAVAE